MAEEQRDYAKQLAYGLLYGKGPHALAVDLSCDVKKAAKQQESFMRAIPNVVRESHLRQDMHATSKGNHVTEGCYRIWYNDMSDKYELVFPTCHSDSEFSTTLQPRC